MPDRHTHSIRKSSWLLKTEVKALFFSFNFCVLSFSINIYLSFNINIHSYDSKNVTQVFIKLLGDK